MSHPIASNVRSMLHQGKTMIAVLDELPDPPHGRSGTSQVSALY